MTDPIRRRPKHVAYELHEIAARAVQEQSRVVEQLNPAEPAVVLGTREVAVRSMAEQEGPSPDQPSVLDATNRQVKAVAAVWRVVNRWDCALDPDRRLVDEPTPVPRSTGGFATPATSAEFGDRRRPHR